MDPTVSFACSPHRVNQHVNVITYNKLAQKTKTVGRWAKELFTFELAAASKQDRSDTITIERPKEFDEDVEIGPITIYENTSTKGTIVIPEESHENTIDGGSDYPMSFSMSTELLHQ